MRKENQEATNKTTVVLFKHQYSNADHTAILDGEKLIEMHTNM